MADLDIMNKAIVDELVSRTEVGYESAAQLLITTGDNPGRLGSEVSFAALCGVSLIPASSGKIQRQRLNRGGDRAANSALHIIAIGRLRLDATTQTYVSGLVSEGHSRLEALRCLKRYMWLYNHHITHKGLYHQLPIVVMKTWQDKCPELFTKRVVNYAGPDSYLWG